MTMQEKSTSTPPASAGPASDPIWDIAWAWVRRTHDAGCLDAAAQAELLAWLGADPLHRREHDKACRLWLLVGMVPPANPVDITGLPTDGPSV